MSMLLFILAGISSQNEKHNANVKRAAEKKKSVLMWYGFWPQHIHRILSLHKGLCDKGHTTLNIGYFISQTGSIRFMIWVRDDEMVKGRERTEKHEMTMSTKKKR